MPEVDTTASPVETTPEVMGAPVSDDTAPVTAEPSATPEGDTPTEESAEPETWEDYVAKLEADDSPHKEDWKKHNEKLSEEAWTKATDYLKPLADQTRAEATRLADAHQKSNESLRLLVGRLDKLSQNSGGMVSLDQIQEVLGSDPSLGPALASIGEAAQARARDDGKAQGAAEQSFATSAWMIEGFAKAAGKPSLVKELTDRMGDVKAGRIDPDTWLKEAAEKVLNAPFARGKEAGLKGAKEAANVQERKGQHPTQQAGSVAGGGKITYAQIQKMTPAQIDALPEGALQKAIDEASK